MSPSPSELGPFPDYRDILGVLEAARRIKVSIHDAIDGSRRELAREGIITEVAYHAGLVVLLQSLQDRKVTQIHPVIGGVVFPCGNPDQLLVLAGSKYCRPYILQPEAKPAGLPRYSVDWTNDPKHNIVTTIDPGDVTAQSEPGYYYVRRPDREDVYRTLERLAEALGAYPRPSKTDRTTHQIALNNLAVWKSLRDAVSASSEIKFES